MADVVICGRCGHTQPAIPLLLGRFASALVCPKCMGIVVRDQGELDGPEERADPDTWGGIGWA